MAVRSAITIDPVTAAALVQVAERGAEWYRQNGIVLPVELLDAIADLRAASSVSVPHGIAAEQASGIMSGMDSATAASLLGVTPRRVTAMCAAGVLDAKRTPAGWQIGSACVEKRMKD